MTVTNVKSTLETKGVSDWLKIAPKSANSTQRIASIALPTSFPFLDPSNWNRRKGRERLAG